jgi:cAMP-dependent protein kinase regulator
MGEQEPSSLDQALEAWASGDLAEALRNAVAVLEAHPADALALFLSAYLGGKLGEPGRFRDGLRAAAERAVDLGDLPLALAMCGFTRELGLDVASLYDTAASAFARGSSRAQKRRAPPVLPTLGPRMKALPSSLDAQVLVERTEKAVRAAVEHLLTLPGGDGPLPSAPLFSALDRVALRAFIEIFEPRLVARGQAVVEEGTAGAEAFVVACGELDVSRHALRSSSPVHLARLGPGALFGEMALLSRAPRAATVTTSTPALLLVARKRELDAAVGKTPELGREFAEHCRRRMLDNLIRTSAILHNVHPTERADLVQRFAIRTFEPGERLIKQGSATEGLFLIASGEVSVVHHEPNGDKTVVVQLGPGEVLGEVALVLRRPANADVVATHPTVTLLLPRERFLEAVRAHPQVFVDLYELASRRDEETSSIAGLETSDLDESVLV